MNECHSVRRPRIDGHYPDPLASSHEAHSPQYSDEPPYAHYPRLSVHGFGHTRYLGAVGWAELDDLSEQEGHVGVSRYTGKAKVHFLLGLQPERSVEDIDTDTCMSVEDS